MISMRKFISSPMLFYGTVVFIAVQLVTFILVFPPRFGIPESTEDEGCIIFASWYSQGSGHVSTLLLIGFIITTAILTLVVLFPGAKLSFRLRKYQSHSTHSKRLASIDFFQVFLGLCLFAIPLFLEIIMLITLLFSQTGFAKVCY